MVFPELHGKPIEVHIPLLNEINSVEPLIGSLESQTFGEFIVFIHDNASDDGSTDLIRRSIGNNPRYRHIVYNTRKDSWRQGQRIFSFPKACKYISYRSANDKPLPDYFGEIHEILESNAHVSLAYSHGYEAREGDSVAFHDPAGRISTLNMIETESLEHVVSRYSYPFSLWGTYRKDVFESLNPVVCYGADHVLVAQACLKGYVESTKRPLDLRLSRKPNTANDDRSLHLNSLWTSHHPELLAGMDPRSPFFSPDIHTPFCSMLIGHLEMLRYQCTTHDKLAQLSKIAAECLFRRFGGFIMNEISLLKNHLLGTSGKSLSFSGDLSTNNLNYARYLPISRLHSILNIEYLYNAYSDSL